MQLGARAQVARSARKLGKFKLKQTKPGLKLSGVYAHARTPVRLRPTSYFQVDASRGVSHWKFKPSRTDRGGSRVPAGSTTLNSAVYCYHTTHHDGDVVLL